MGIGQTSDIIPANAMPQNVKFGVLAIPHPSKEANLGDDIQAIAARRFLPRIDSFVNRENLNKYEGDPTIIIMNGWFMHHPEKFPPSDRIIPIFESFHINDAIANRFFNREVIDYFQKYSPIGCRDLYTTKLLRDRGIDAYFSGCLTLTLDKEEFVDKTANEDIVFSDILFCYSPKIRRMHYWEYLKWYLDNMKCRKIKHDLIKIMPKKISERAKYVTQFTGNRFITLEERMFLAEELLRKYANAKLVITSRLHSALPCLAFGTPVLFVVNNIDDVRFSGLGELLNMVTSKQLFASSRNGEIEIDGKRLKWEHITNKNNHCSLRANLIDNVSKKLNNLLRVINTSA